MRHGRQGRLRTCLAHPRPVAQAFQPAGSRNFLVPRCSRRLETGDWKVPRTRRQECLRYGAKQVPGFQPAGFWGILPQISGRRRRSNTNARLEAARTGRRGRLPYDAGHSGRDHWEWLRGRNGCVAREVGRASNLPVPGASCPKFLEGRGDRTPTRGWKPLQPAGGDACPTAPGIRGETIGSSFAPERDVWPER